MNGQNDNLEAELRRIVADKQGDYEQRTRHKDEDGRPVFVNRLVREDSPYLLQHAHNPVDWYPWGDEAFERARQDDKPVFLSIGYSTCHWCHVMEAESFDNIQIAGLLNDAFVCIKLDREQFPDIDEYYMTGVQIVSGQGGWPMSSFLLSDGQPFFGATYFPPGQFAQLLERIRSLWSGQRGELERSATTIAERIAQLLQGRQETRDLDLARICRDADRILQREDATMGGLAGAPKFPQEPLLLYFLDGVSRHRDLHKLAFVTRALDHMGRGGIYDQVGGGFHRYSTDANWLVPHFEKMLYNQSQLAMAYLWAWRLTGRRYFRRIVEQTLNYVLREMTRPEGAFYSATDADSEDTEGLYFVWSLDEVKGLLPPDDVEFLQRTYTLEEPGNFEGASILALRAPMEELLGNLPLPEFEARLDGILERLLTARQSRIAPLRDDKMIVAWSAGMATALTQAAGEFGAPVYLQAAVTSVEAIWSQCFEGQESLRRISLHGETSIPGQLEDYASLCEALLALFDETGSGMHLMRAATLMDQALRLFWNEESGGFYLSQQAGQGPALARSSSASDGATRSAYGIAVHCLAKLAERRLLAERAGYSGTTDFAGRFHAAVKRVSAELDEYGPGHVTLISAILHHESGASGTVRYGGEGLLRVQVRRTDTERDSGLAAVEVSLVSFDGYHVADDQTGPPGRAPITLALAEDEGHWQLAAIEQSEAVRLEDSGDARRAYTLRLRRTDQPADALSRTFSLVITVQLCNESVCLAPEKFIFRV